MLGVTTHSQTFEFNVTHTRKVTTVTAQKEMYPTLRVIH